MSIEQEAVALALDKMLNKQSYFDICTIDKLGDHLGVNPKSHPTYSLLNTLHCVEYVDMSAELKGKLPELITSVLTAKFDTSVMSKALFAVRTGEIKDLPNTEDDLPTRLLK